MAIQLDTLDRQYGRNYIKSKNSVEREIKLQ